MGGEVSQRMWLLAAGVFVLAACLLRVGLGLSFGPAPALQASGITAAEPSAEPTPLEPSVEPGPAQPAPGLHSELVTEASTPVTRSGVEPRSDPKASTLPGELRDSCETCVALTFDDGPGPYTDELLDVLEAEGVQATFFVTGVAASRHPQIVARMSQTGMEVGLHGWDHVDMTKLDLEGQQSQVDRPRDAVESAGVPDAMFFRPAYGSRDANTSRLGVPLILWDVDPEDWRTRDASMVVEATMEAVRPGSIVLLHDIHSSTVEAVPVLLDELRAAGLEPVTVGELLGSAAIPGSVHYRGSLD